MASTNVGPPASEAPGLFSTPVARVQSVAVRPPHTHATPTTPRLLTRPSEALAEVKTMNGLLQTLAEQLHAWATTMSPPAGPNAGPDTTSTTHVAQTATEACAAHDEALPWCATGEQDAFFFLQTVMENTRRLVAQCQSEVRVLVGRCSGSASSPSGATSGHASCGLSYAESPSDGPAHRLGADGEGGSRWTSELHPHGAVGSALPAQAALPESHAAVSCVATHGDGHANVPGVVGSTAAAPAHDPAPGDAQVQHPQRRRWPSQQFCYMTHVEFKRRRVRRFLSPVPVKPGTYVIVPGDRGYDCGLVVQCAMWNPYKQNFEADTIQALDAGVLPPGHYGSIMEVIRVATDDEVQRLHCEHVSMERLALNMCREIADRLHLPMEVLDCEYQYDGTKISFFFDAAVAIDFRQLNKELFRVFNARIWMQNTNSAVRNGGPQGSSSAVRQTGAFRCGFRGNPSTLH